MVSSLALRRSLRITRLASHVGVGLGLSALVFPWIGGAGRAACFRWWSRHLLRILRVRIRYSGEPGSPKIGAPVLILSNHVSWLDVFVIRSQVDCRFVAKSEIRSWPFVGWLVAQQGTVFVQRERARDTSRVNATLEDALRSGTAVTIFPEGTTTDGTEVKPFRGSLLQPLVQAEGYALPVALRYLHPDGKLNHDASYTGNRSLWESTLLLTAQHEIHAEVIFLPPMPTAGRHRREIAEHCGATVAEALRLPSPGRKPGKSPDPPGAAP